MKSGRDACAAARSVTEQSQPAPINRPGLQQALKEYLQTNRGVRADTDQIFVLPTAQAALNLIAAIVVTPGDGVLDRRFPDIPVPPRHFAPPAPA